MNDLAPEHPTGRLTLRQRLATSDIVSAPGICDGLTALLAEQAGFETLYLSGASLAYTRMGRPDLGFLSLRDVADHVSHVRDRVRAQLIVDADTGFGNALNVQRTVRTLERAGADAIQIEDQFFPKRCGHLADKMLISACEMAGKVRAAVDARNSEDTLIIARTDAIAVEGFQAALDRAARYAEAGADVLFVEAPRSVDQMQDMVAALCHRPLLANLVEGGHTPLLDLKALEHVGFSIAIFPGGAVRALARTAQDYYRVLAEDGSTARFRDRMFDFSELNELLGTPELLAEATAYTNSG